MKQLETVFVIVLAMGVSFLLIGDCEASDSTTLEIRKTEEAVLMDAGLDQPAWRQAKWYGDFTLLGKPNVAAKVKTKFAMLHDGETLYVAVKAVHRPGGRTWYACGVCKEKTRRSFRPSHAWKRGAFFNQSCSFPLLRSGWTPSPSSAASACCAQRRWSNRATR